MYIVYAFMLWVQAIRHQVRRLRIGHTTHPGGAQGAGQRLPFAVFCLCDVRQTIEHWWRVLFNGRPEIGV